MNLTIPAIVFITTNLWGLFGGIPFTAIQPSRPFLDRTVGCFQLASTVYTLEQIQPYLSSTRVVLIPGPTVNVTAQQTRPDLRGIWSTNATIHHEPVSRAATFTRASRELISFPTAWPAISPTVTFPALLSSGSTCISEWLALLSGWLAPLFTDNQQLEAPRDTLYENLVLILLVMMLSILVKQTFQYPDGVRETALLRGEIESLRTGLRNLNDWIMYYNHAVQNEMQDATRDQHKAMNEARRYLDRIEHGISRLLGLGRGLTALRQDLASSRREFYTARDAVHNAVQISTDVIVNAVDGVHDVQSRLGGELHELRETIDLMTDVRWALVDQLLQYPSTVCDQLATTVASTISEHLNERTTTDTTNEASVSRLDNGKWAT